MSNHDSMGQASPEIRWDRIYSPQSELARPLSLLKLMYSDLLAARELAIRLFIRNISAAYRRTFLGYVWAFLPPLVMTLTFAFLQKQRVLSVDTGALPYFVFLLSGTMLWQTFYDALNAPLKMALQSKVMLAKINFPREALILAGIAEVAFNFLIRCCFLIPVLLLYGFFPDLHWLLALFGLLGLILIGTVLGVLILPIGVIYEDVEKALPLFAGLWMFLTPVVYAAPTEGAARWMMYLNPVAPVLAQTREWLLQGSHFFAVQTCVVTAIFACLSLVGWMLYRLSLPHIIARLPS